MGTKEPSGYVFGRFDWNINATTSIEITSNMVWVNLVGVLLEISMIVFFIWKFCIKKSGFREPYYFMYVMGCTVDAIPKILNFLSTYVIQKNAVLLCILSTFRFYNANYMTLWIFLLALNRCSAIFFTMEFTSYWSPRNTAIVCVFMSVYPFLTHIFNPEYMFCEMIGGFYCRISLRMTARQTDFEYYYGYISDMSFSVLSTGLCLASAANLVITKRMLNQHVEKVLLVQSFTSSVFLMLSTTASWLASVNGGLPEETYVPELIRAQNLQRFLNALSGIFYNLHHYIGILLILFFGKTVRNAYLGFYRIDKVINFIWKPKIQIHTVQIAPAGATPSAPTPRRSQVQTVRHR